MGDDAVGSCNDYCTVQLYCNGVQYYYLDGVQYALLRGKKYCALISSWVYSSSKVLYK